MAEQVRRRSPGSLQVFNSGVENCYSLASLTHFGRSLLSRHIGLGKSRKPGMSRSRSSPIQNGGLAASDNRKIQILLYCSSTHCFLSCCRRIYPQNNEEEYARFFENSCSLFTETATSKARSECARYIYPYTKVAVITTLSVFDWRHSGRNKILTSFSVSENWMIVASSCDWAPCLIRRY